MGQLKEDRVFLQRWLLISSMLLISACRLGTTNTHVGYKRTLLEHFKNHENHFKCFMWYKTAAIGSFIVTSLLCLSMLSFKSAICPKLWKRALLFVKLATWIALAFYFLAVSEALADNFLKIFIIGGFSSVAIFIVCH